MTSKRVPASCEGRFDQKPHKGRECQFFVRLFNDV